MDLNQRAKSGMWKSREKIDCLLRKVKSRRRWQTFLILTSTDAQACLFYENLGSLKMSSNVTSPLAFWGSWIRNFLILEGSQFCVLFCFCVVCVCVCICVVCVCVCLELFTAGNVYYLTFISIEFVAFKIRSSAFPHQIVNICKTGSVPCLMCSKPHSQSL